MEVTGDAGVHLIINNIQNKEMAAVAAMEEEEAMDIQDPMDIALQLRGQVAGMEAMEALVGMVATGVTGVHLFY